MLEIMRNSSPAAFNHSLIAASGSEFVRTKSITSVLTEDQMVGVGGGGGVGKELKRTSSIISLTSIESYHQLINDHPDISSASTPFAGGGLTESYGGVIETIKQQHLSNDDDLLSFGKDDTTSENNNIIMDINTSIKRSSNLSEIAIATWNGIWHPKVWCR